MDRFVDSLNAEARLNDIGRFIAEERILLHATNRLLYTHDREQHPEIATVDVVKPVFIIGLPRTGTTILHDILNQDPANRAPLTWELMFPSPPPEASIGNEDPRVAACQATIPDDDLQSTLFKAMHPMGATLSQECVVMMGEAMVTPLFHNQFRVPAYQDWVDDGADWSAVYAFHRRQLQHLWWHKPGDRWMLKTGAHMWGLDQLLATYPDARIVFTHRDPVKSMTSYASLTTLVRSMGSDDVDPYEIAEDWTARLKRDAGAVDGRAGRPGLPGRRVLRHVLLGLRGRPVRRDRADLRRPRPPDVGRGRRRPCGPYIADHPKGVDGIHRYRPEEYGVDPTVVRRDFAPYIERFGLEPEAPEPEDEP